MRFSQAFWFQPQKRHVYEVTRLFFDREGVMRRVGAARLAMYRGAGALVRTISRQSLRPPRRKSLGEMTKEERDNHKRAQRRARRLGLPRPQRPYADPVPGKPPRNKQGLVRDNIWFSLDPLNDVCVVGPAVLPGLGTVHALEYGGTVLVKKYGRGAVPQHFRAFPFMRPALEKAAPQFPEMFRDSLIKHKV